MEEQIKQNAELVIREMRKTSGFSFGYDAKSVAWLDGFIERQRKQDDITEDTIHGLVNVFGSYLGECVIKTFGGHWENDGKGWRVSFDENNAVYPFAKVQKQFENGRSDSIESFFSVIPVIFGSASEEAPRKNFWWKFW